MTATASYETTTPQGAVDAASWFAALVQTTAIEGLGDLYIEVRTSATATALLAWTRPLTADEGYTALQSRPVPHGLAADPQRTCDEILAMVGLQVGAEDPQVAQRQMRVEDRTIEVRMVHTPSASGCRLALRMNPARSTAAAVRAAATG